MSAIFADVTSALVVATCPGAADLLDASWFDTIREILRKVMAWLAAGGVALALGVSVLFIAAWVLSHLRSPRPETERGEGSSRLLPYVALAISYVPPLLTAVAAAMLFIPGMTPLILRTFAVAVIVAGACWVVAVGSIIAGGSVRDLARSRRALLLSGTPWYALALYLATWL